MSKEPADGKIKILRPCPRCGLADCLEEETNRDDTYIQCSPCGLRMSKAMWELPRPLEMHHDSKAMAAYERFHDLFNSYNDLALEVSKLRNPPKETPPPKREPRRVWVNIYPSEPTLPTCVSHPSREEAIRSASKAVDEVAVEFVEVLR